MSDIYEFRINRGPFHCINDMQLEYVNRWNGNFYEPSGDYDDMSRNRNSGTIEAIRTRYIPSGQYASARDCSIYNSISDFYLLVAKV